MSGIGSASPSAGQPRRKRPFPFGLVMLAFGLGLGFYGGVAATKRAMTAPVWVQNLFGFTMPVAAPQAPPVAAVAVPTPPAKSSPAAPPSAPEASPDKSNEEPKDTTTDKPQKKSTADTKDLVGNWTVTDSFSKDGGPSSSLTSSYVFRADNSGEFDANGTKLYDFHWTPAGDEISVDFDGEGPDPNTPWNARLKWSLNGDKTVLTLIPSSGKDPRSFVYSLGPGVYHRKGI